MIKRHIENTFKTQVLKSVGDATVFDLWSWSSFGKM